MNHKILIEGLQMLLRDRSSALSVAIARIQNPYSTCLHPLAIAQDAIETLASAVDDYFKVYNEIEELRAAQKAEASEP